MTADALMKRLLWIASLAVLLIAVVGGLLGYFSAGMNGLVSALIGAGLALLFCGATILSVLIGQRLDPNAFFGVVLGAWLAKLLVFLVIVFLLRGQPFVVNSILVATMLVAAAVTVAMDAYLVLTARIAITEVPNSKSGA